MFYIEYYKKNTEKLQDISEEGYPTLELCMAQIESENKQDKEDMEKMLAQYEEDLKKLCT